MRYANYYACILFATSLFLFSCKKETVKDYSYELEKETVKSEGTQKPNLKTTTEFISMAYSDIFGTTITNDKLVNISMSYNSWGDKKLMEDLIIRNFLNAPGKQIPSKSEMDADIEGFIKKTYQRLLNRLPNEMELWQMKTFITENSGTTPEVVYYSILTSNEYRFY